MPKYFDAFTMPLVDAIRETGLLHPLTGRGPEFQQYEGDYSDRRGAMVIASPVNAYVAPHIELLIEKVLRDYANSEAMWEGNLDIVKRYIPSMNPSPSEHSYNFHITAFERTAPDDVKLKAIKKMVLLTVKSIRKHS